MLFLLETGAEFKKGLGYVQTVQTTHTSNNRKHANLLCKYTNGVQQEIKSHLTRLYYSSLTADCHEEAKMEKKLVRVGWFDIRFDGKSINRTILTE